MNEKKILVIIPAYNESRNIKNTINEILKSNLPLDLLVIDDGSADNTVQEALHTPAQVITLPFNLGIGGAVQTGLKFAQQKKYDMAVRLDGDGQHNAQFLPQIIQPLMDQSADMVMGSRFIEPFTGYRSSFIRRIGISFFASLISFLTGTQVTDPTSGYNAFNAKAIEIFAEYYPQDFPEPEAIMVAHRSGLKVVEVPVEMRKRASGHSSIRYVATLYYMIKVTFAICLGLIKKKRMVKS